MAASMRVGARSAKILQFLQNRSQKTRINWRNYLSAAYPCIEEWTATKRKDPLLQIPDPNQYFVDVSMRLSSETKFNTAIDVDLFLQIAEGKAIQHEVENILHRYDN